MDLDRMWEAVERERKKSLQYLPVGAQESEALSEKVVEKANEARVFAAQPFLSDTPTLRKSEIIPHGTFVFLCDLHVPYVNYRVIDAVAKEKADGIVIGGDVFDAERFSPHSSRKRVPFQQEYEIALSIFGEISSWFKVVILIPGNHDRRIARRFNSLQESAELGFLVNPDPLYHLARGRRMLDGFSFGEESYNNVVYYDNAVLFGNVIFDHPDNFSSVPGGTVRRVIKHFVTLSKEPFDYVVIGHTHVYAEIMELGKVGIEGGCACAELPYTYLSGRRPYGPQTNMYLLLFFESGKLVSYEKRVIGR